MKVELPDEAREDIEDKRERLEYLAEHGHPRLREYVQNVLDAMEGDS